ncbi:hypothetical protein BpHYR1_036932 [Brachionus plicatilis]|uniref:Uncharacterized protein n=1 Tax=Brachionus plicatilis TaxID=10195 RepID=A0A3M7PJE9_BRAPC|nr:hypothetical protein BpHYR1_036932 [Brachionus plicatilis]
MIDTQQTDSTSSVTDLTRKNKIISYLNNSVEKPNANFKFYIPRSESTLVNDSQTKRLRSIKSNQEETLEEGFDNSIRINKISSDTDLSGKSDYETELESDNKS